jgi:hypothetical protein
MYNIVVKKNLSIVNVKWKRTVDELDMFVGKYRLLIGLGYFQRN